MMLIAKTNDGCVCACNPDGNCSFFLSSPISGCPFLVKSFLLPFFEKSMRYLISANEDVFVSSKRFVIQSNNLVILP
jgi:hypothetical protein